MKISGLYIYKVSAKIFVAICCLLVVSCVKVDLCQEEYHPHTGILAISYDWQEIPEADRPDSMLVFANRIINTWRCGFITPREGTNEEGIGGRYRFGAIHKDRTAIYPTEPENPINPDTPNEEEPANPDTPNEEEGTTSPDIPNEENEGPTTEDTVVPNDTFHVRAGEFQLVAINSEHMIHSDGESVEDFRIELLEEYENNQLGIRDLIISYVERDLKSDPSLNIYDKDWIDFNRYAKYIASEIRPIYRATIHHKEGSQEFTKAIRSNSTIPVTLYPEKITQDVTISFPVIGEDGVYVDSMIAEISGIPHKMRIYSGELLTDKTLKMLFKIPTPEQQRDTTINIQIEEKEETVKAWVSDFEETISVMGLMRNNDQSYTTGAGIMQLCVYAHTTDRETGKTKSKTIYAKVNLFNTIKRAQLLKRTDSDAIVQATKKGMLRIEDSFLIITRDLLIQTSDDDVSIDTWKEMDGDIDIDI